MNNRACAPLLALFSQGLPWDRSAQGGYEINARLSSAGIGIARGQGATFAVANALLSGTAAGRTCGGQLTATRQASRIMSSTPRWSSSSLIRLVSPDSSSRSETVIIASASMRWSAAIVYIIAASISTAT